MIVNSSTEMYVNHRLLLPLKVLYSQHSAITIRLGTIVHGMIESAFQRQSVNTLFFFDRRLRNYLHLTEDNSYA
jgi:hypothetical protein